jgi:diaminopimelate epimerase
MAPLAEIAFVKGHGTGNDFVLIPDLDDVIELSEADVRWLCDRHRGIGANGIIRITRDDDGLYLMDYRNADGSLAEMCGNGARVFLRYLHAKGLVGQHCLFRTRGGIREGWIHSDRSITIDMGPVTVRPDQVEVHVGERHWSGHAVDAPNPHAVVSVRSVDDAGDLRAAPFTTPDSAFPDGVNVEFVEQIDLDHVRMRVFERGVGETLSCGTGACAVAATIGRDVHIEVPGGMVFVSFDERGHAMLRGPADLVARGTVLVPVSH